MKNSLDVSLWQISRMSELYSKCPRKKSRDPPRTINSQIYSFEPNTSFFNVRNCSFVLIRLKSRDRTDVISRGAPGVSFEKRTSQVTKLRTQASRCFQFSRELRKMDPRPKTLNCEKWIPDLLNFKKWIREHFKNNLLQLMFSLKLTITTKK